MRATLIFHITRSSQKTATHKYNVRAKGGVPDTAAPAALQRIRIKNKIWLARCSKFWEAGCA
jgi:hypothetical protein